LKGYRNWLPLLYFFINAAVVNAWRIQYIYKQQHGVTRLPTQLHFRERLYQQLFSFGPEPHTGLPSQRLDASQNHQRIQLGKRRVCVWCCYKKRQGQLDKKQPRQSTSGCIGCGRVTLCLKTRCWMEFHEMPGLGG
jgi:hypothetical protein